MPEEAPFPTPRLFRRRPLTLACCAGLPPSAALSPQAGRGEGSASPCVVRMTTGEWQTERDASRLSPLAGRGFGLRPNERSEAKRG